MFSIVRGQYDIWPATLLRRGSQWAFTCSNVTIETLEQGVKYVQS